MHNLAWVQPDIHVGFCTYETNKKAELCFSFFQPKRTKRKSLLYFRFFGILPQRFVFVYIYMYIYGERERERERERVCHIVNLYKMQIFICKEQTSAFSLIVVKVLLSASQTKKSLCFHIQQYDLLTLAFVCIQTQELTQKTLFNWKVEDT